MGSEDEMVGHEEDGERERGMEEEGEKDREREKERRRGERKRTMGAKKQTTRQPFPSLRPPDPSPPAIQSFSHPVLQLAPARSPNPVNGFLLSLLGHWGQSLICIRLTGDGSLSASHTPS